MEYVGPVPDPFSSSTSSAPSSGGTSGDSRNGERDFTTTPISYPEFSLFDSTTPAGTIMPSRDLYIPELSSQQVTDDLTWLMQAAGGGAAPPYSTLIPTVANSNTFGLDAFLHKQALTFPPQQRLLFQPHHQNFLYPAPIAPTSTAPPPLLSFPTQTAATHPTPSKSLNTPAPKGERLRSCAACRIRRVKCERSPGETQCLKCIEKGLSCTPLPVTERKKPSRSGKRIEQAKVLFGNDLAAEAGAGEGKASKRSRLDVAGNKGTSTLPDPSNAVVSRLITTELETVLSSSLINLYFLLPQARIPMLEGTNFRQTLESTNYRMSEMDEQSRVLFSVVLSLAARVSDHPLLIGSGGPTLSDLAAATREGRDLRAWGEKREDACVALTAKAVESADRAGVWRIPSLINVATLLLLEGLEDHEEELGSTDPRPFAGAYMSHLRHLLENDPDGSAHVQLSESGLMWTCFMRDGTLSAFGGRQPFFSDDDLLLLGPAIDLPPLAKMMRSPHIDTNPSAVNNRLSPFWNLLFSFMMHLSRVVRAFPAGATGLRAKLAPYLNEDFANDTLAALKLASEAVPMLERRAEAYFGPPSQLNASSKGKLAFLRILRLNRVSCALLLNKVVTQRIDARYAQSKITELYNQSQSPSGDEPYWDRLAALHTKTRMFAFEAAREVVALTRLNFDSSISLGIMSGAQLLFSRSHFWLTLVVQTPTEEEGGPAGFTFEAKLDDLRCVLKALHSVGWSFKRLSRPVPWLRAEIEAVEERQEAYWAKLALTTPARVDGDMAAAVSGGQLSERELVQILEEIMANLPAPQSTGSIEEDTNVVMEMMSAMLS